MKLLAIDTSADLCSVALDLGTDLIETSEPGLRHSELILGMVRDVLARGGVTLGDLDVIAFARGPGSFTSLRIGAGVVQGLALGSNVPVVAVSSLAALAQSCKLDRVLAALDARMDQVYWGIYERHGEGVRAAGEEIVCAPQRASVPGPGRWSGAGSGWKVHDEKLRACVGASVGEVFPEARSTARAVAELARIEFAEGRALPADAAVPVYVRDNVAVKLAER